MIFGVMLFLWLLSVGCYAFGLYWGSKAIVQIIAERQEKKWKSHKTSNMAYFLRYTWVDQAGLT